MKILLLVPRHLPKLADATHLEVWEETSLPIFQVHNFWYKALKSLGHDVRLFIYSGKNPKLDYYSILGKSLSDRGKLIKNLYQFFGQICLPVYKIQDQILKLAENLRPNVLILSGNTNNLFPETLFQIKKKYRRKLVLLNGLSPVRFATKFEKEMVGFFDYVLTNDRYHAIDWLMLGAKHAAALPVSAIDPEIHKLYQLTKSERVKFSSDISFVGSLSPEFLYRGRIKFLENLTDFNLKIWTFDKETILFNKKLKKFYKGAAEGIKMFKIFQASAINLNFHGHTMPAGGNLRTFEILGCGGFELVDRTNPAWFKIGKEIVTFKTIGDLRQKIRYFLNHSDERREIAKRGMERVRKDHTYTARFAKMLKIVLHEKQDIS